MKKSYITPEITFMEAEACEPLCASQKPTKDSGFYVGGGQGGDNNSSEGEMNPGYGDDFEQGAKSGDFFCDNFEYDFDF